MAESNSFELADGIVLDGESIGSIASSAYGLYKLHSIFPLNAAKTAQQRRMRGRDILAGLRGSVVLNRSEEGLPQNAWNKIVHIRRSLFN